MSVESEVRAINEKRHNIWNRGKEILQRATEEHRGLTTEEQQNWDHANDDLTRLDDQRWSLVSSTRAADELARVNGAFESVRTPEERTESRQREEAVLRDFFRPLRAPGRVNALNFSLDRAANLVEHARQGASEKELRAVIATDTGASGGSLTVPTLVAPEIYAFLTASVAMRRMNCTITTTPSGAPMNFPKVSAHGIGTQIANQDTAFTGTNPVLASMTLNAYDFGELVPVSNDMLEDSGVDVLAFLGENIARAIGIVTATGYVTGSGSSTIQGIQGAVTGSGTLATGGSLIGLPVAQELEKLIDLQYSIADSYRFVRGGNSWLMRDLTGAKVRKIRDGAGGTTGQFVWQPSPTRGAIDGQPDTFLGDPVYFDPNVASMASDAKTVFYGNWSAYYIRDAGGGFRLDRSDDLYFDKNQVAFRGLLRTDGDLVDSNAINCLHQLPA